MKKRYGLTLTEESTDRFKYLMKESGARYDALSTFVDEYLKMMLPVVEEMARAKRESLPVDEAVLISEMFRRVMQSTEG